MALIDLLDTGLPQNFDLFKKTKKAISWKRNKAKFNKMRYACTLQLNRASL